MTFWTLDQLASRYGLSKSFFYKLVESGRLPHHKIGGRVRVSDDDRLAWEASCRRDVKQPRSRRRQRRLVPGAVLTQFFEG